MQYCLYLRKSRADSEAEAQGEGDVLAACTRKHYWTLQKNSI